MINTILVPVDGSSHSRQAMEFAVGLAARYAASLHLLHVAQQPVSDHVLTLGAAAVMVSGTQADLDKAGRKVVEAATGIAHRAGVDKVTTEVTTGDPAKRIIDAARSIGADMIVMGSRGLGDLSGMLLGSVSHKVGHLAPCTCVTVR
jgi:nucleotide-binding universal stress UspA family protein